MATFEIRWEGAQRPDDDNARSVSLGTPVIASARDWMEALGEALDRYGLGRDTVSSAVCLIRRDGAIDVVDPDSGNRFVVRQVEGGDDELDGFSLSSVELSVTDDLMEAPEPSRSPAFARVEGTAEERLAALDDALSALPVDLAGDALAAALLELLLGHVPAESASILVETSPGGPVRFAAAHGPAADRLAEVTVPAGRGVVGVVVRTGTTLYLREAERNPDHFDAVDRAVGYRTGALLAVPVGTSAPWGAIELLNPFGHDRFTEVHGKLAARVAAALHRRSR